MKFSLQGTGIGVVVIGACLLSWAAYLSMWMPTWVWLSFVGLTFLGVSITAFSTATAIATVAPDVKAAHRVNIKIGLCIEAVYIGYKFILFNLPSCTYS